MHTMQLSQYLETPGVTAAGLARKCQVATSTITRTAKGDMTPKLPLVAAIYEHTGGAVTPQDHIDKLKESLAKADRAPEAE